MELILLLSILSLIFNIILSCIVAHYGKKREIGWLDSFFASLLFSPIIGFICVALSDKLNDNKINHFNIINDKTITKQKPYSIDALLILLAIFILLGIIFTYNENKTKTESCAKYYTDSCRIDTASESDLITSDEELYNILNK